MLGEAASATREADTAAIVVRNFVWIGDPSAASRMIRSECVTHTLFGVEQLLHMERSR